MSQKKKHYPKKHHKGSPPAQSPQKPQQPAIHGNFFNGNLVQNMDFGGDDHELSGFVKRELIITDNKGNKQIAREKQFFNAGKKIKKVTVKDDESEF